MKCSEIIKILETLSPRSMACDWDNPGLLAGRSGKEVKTIFLIGHLLDSFENKRMVRQNHIRPRLLCLLNHRICGVYRQKDRLHFLPAAPR